ncbi:Bacterial flagellin N-terminal helical region [Acididesulfobacillus acetoxydans]|uniref:Bacterial flagellin N-terminal helical region n=1 Tax=Acididesulfobacillus acetoxydans TaxID=1561005 RepID=A0A8S0Y0I3_9FIRM|nr:flagellar hook-associated protein FlgL [Acididesulfobacillus acetoxydans]CAA7603177.1 Bacterial flagellin N-terminal helical region [Acididesulfobacillus acetoxydans]CEJ07595.1 Flagellar hook-associated protein 3 [Acididesulfobacillus acetoxydans]
MRITNIMMSQNLLSNLEAVQTTVQKYQNQLASGKKINQPADDPVGTQLTLGLKGALSDNSQWQANASQGLSVLQTTNDTLQNMMQMLQRARTLAVEVNNGTFTAADRATTADEVQQIQQEVGSLANTQVGDMYIFSGTSSSQPWQGGANWTGNAGLVNIEVGKGEQIPINADFTGLFQGTGSIFNVLSGFVGDLKSNNLSGLQNDLQNIDNQVQSFTAKEAELGALTDRVQTVQKNLQQSSTNLSQNLSTVQDADVATVITQLTNAQNVYQAALSVGARYIQPSLADYMQ